MEKKVALVLLSLIGLGFYVSSLAFLIGNPFTTTEGSYRYSFSNVTVEVPLGWVDNLFKLANVKGLNLTTSNEKVIIHVGNSTTTISGKNWEHYISRIGGSIIAFIAQQGVNQITSNWADSKPVSQPTVIIEKPYLLQDLLLGFIVGLAVMYDVVGTERGRKTTKKVLSFLRKRILTFQQRLRRKKVE